jgi:hypothetical protein
MWEWIPTHQPDPAMLGLVAVTTPSKRLWHWALPETPLQALCDNRLRVLSQEDLDKGSGSAPIIQGLQRCRACGRSHKIHERWQQVQETAGV